MTSGTLCVRDRCFSREPVKSSGPRCARPSYPRRACVKTLDRENISPAPSTPSFPAASPPLLSPARAPAPSPPPSQLLFHERLLHGDRTEADRTAVLADGRRRCRRVPEEVDGAGAPPDHGRPTMVDVFTASLTPSPIFWPAPSPLPARYCRSPFHFCLGMRDWK